MSKTFNKHDSLEQLLQKEANKQRMYPSEAIWDNIRVELHGKPKWPALFIAFISIVGLLIITTVFNYPPKSLLIKCIENNQPIQSIANNTTSSKKEIAANSLIKNKAEDTKNLKAFEIAHLIKNYSIKTASNNTINDVEINNNIEDESLINNNNSLVESKKIRINFSNKLTTIDNEDVVEKSIANILQIVDENKVLDSDSNIDKSIFPMAVGGNLSKESETYLNQFKKSAQTKNNLNNRWKLQFYLTPSLSYRTLDDDKSRLMYTTNQADRQALSSNVNDVVRHKPAMGIEFGVAVLYGVTKNFYLKSGLQFNSRQYGIDAYRADGQASFAYVQNNQLNTISLQSAYTTKQGFNQTKLDNQLYQISMPIGLQWDFVQGERWGVSVAATLQPTYTFNKNIYIVSTDYKYYADGTSFFRRWNVNSSSELFLTLNSKNIKWFFGPQIRFQQKPTYNDIYPIKEYRVDYGIKVGFTKSLR